MSTHNRDSFCHTAVGQGDHLHLPAARAALVHGNNAVITHVALDVESRLVRDVQIVKKDHLLEESAVRASLLRLEYTCLQHRVVGENLRDFCHQWTIANLDRNGGLLGKIAVETRNNLISIFGILFKQIRTKHTAMCNVTEIGPTIRCAYDGQCLRGSKPAGC